MTVEKEVDLKKVARSDLSWGGILNDQQADKFLHFVIDNSVMKTELTYVKPWLTMSKKLLLNAYAAPSN